VHHNMMRRSMATLGHDLPFGNGPFAPRSDARRKSSQHCDSPPRRLRPSRSTAPDERLHAQSDLWRFCITALEKGGGATPFPPIDLT
jgi:hypothetical protein